MTTPGTTFAVVTGGGTSGHVVAALAVADALVARGHDRQSIHYAGATRGLEQRLLPPTGYPFSLFDVVGLQRSLSMRNLAFLPKLVRSTWQAFGLVRKLSPKVVVNVGGYASFPVTAAARLCSADRGHPATMASRLEARGARRSMRRGVRRIDLAAPG